MGLSGWFVDDEDRVVESESMVESNETVDKSWVLVGRM